jgi:2-dehydro-3-deoxyglucarate aldolase/4-hydroxy-2-oxoheptanedioate aldolase
MMASFLQQLAAGGACRFGTWVKMAALEPLELLAHAGFDFVVIDMEHAPHTFETAYRLIVTAQGLGLSALVRLADSQGLDVQRVLDSGADGVLIPRVRSAAEARQAMDGMLFPPLGSRGLGITSRAGRWALEPTPDYVRRGNEDVFRAPQLEDPQAIGEVDAILQTPGINAVFIGQGDLSLVTGKPGSDPANQQLVAQVLQAARSKGVPCGTAVGDAAAARKCQEQGFSFVMVSNDLTLFGKAAVSLMQSVRG